MLLWLLENRGSVSFANLLFMIAAYAVMVLVMLPIHELAHAFAAHKMGDDTAKWNGRLSLNPMAHLDLQGTLMLVLFGVGYARPVPINPYNFRNPRKGVALSALAGPVSNLLMAVLSVGVFRLCVMLIPNAMVLAYLYLILIDVFAWINIRLAVFNLLPIPPLDGSKIFGYFLPDRLVYTMERYSRQISLLLMVLLLVGVLDRPLSFLTNLIGGAIFRLFGF